MKRIWIILVLLSFLFSIFFSSITDSAPVSAHEKEHCAKINSLLSLQVESKLRALEAAPTARGQAKLSQVIPQQVDLVAQQDRKQMLILAI